jgi:2-dehydro-3-deoxyphosphogluconate aldolase/(4S)-4-hydroxy-2-oxoglutarate aldolase
MVPMDIARFRALPLMGILRGIEMDTVQPLAETVLATGIRTIEITMNTAGATGLIRRMAAAGGGRLMVGAGTVLTLSDLQLALDSGATFIVLPILIPGVVARCAERKIPVFPGALTPNEIHAAWSAGATMVKVFPASCVGPAYFREIKGPFRNTELLACGGVTAANLGDYFSHGAAGVAFGASVFRPDWLASREFSRVGAELEKLVAAYRRCREAVL